MDMSISKNTQNTEMEMCTCILKSSNIFSTFEMLKLYMEYNRKLVL